MTKAYYDELAEGEEVLTNSDKRQTTRRALIVDTRAVLATPVCRALHAMGWLVDIFAARGSPAFRSRACSRRLFSPEYSGAAFLRDLTANVEQGRYDSIYLCSEEVLQLLVSSGTSGKWKALPLSENDDLKIALSKNAMIRLAETAGVAVPLTIIPGSIADLMEAANTIGSPLVVKGERGDSSRNVRIASSGSELLRLYEEVATGERNYGGRPAVQQFIPGIQYAVGGLFDRGTPLRVVAYRKLLTYPNHGGLTAKTVTERPAELLDSALAVFEGLHYTGLGQVQFIRDSRDGRFKFLEVNPRVWACIDLARHAGVDLYTPHADLVAGKAVRPNLNFLTGVEYHRLSVEIRLLIQRPQQLPRFLRDYFHTKARWDFDWRDPGPHLPSVHILKQLLGWRPSRTFDNELWDFSAHQPARTGTGQQADTLRHDRPYSA